MNQLSWLLYLADAAGTLKVTALAVVVIALLCCAGAYLTRAFSRDMLKLYGVSDYWKEEHARTASHAEAAGRVFRPALTVAAVAAVLLVFVPSTNTLYAVAASEMGEEILKTETASKATKALNAWLDRQIAGKPAE